jgi:uncharacterized protein (DUF2141 family)
MLKNLIYIIIFLNQLIIPGGDQQNLTVTVSGLKPLKGDLYISLHNRPEYFQVADSALMKKKIQVNEEKEIFTFRNVPDGTYAIAVYHDENLNGMLDVNEKGIPGEGYGFSTKTKFLGRPKFEQAAFELSGNDTIWIKMLYITSKEQSKEDDKK